MSSIVAVHGLGGDWEGTWTDENGKLWLRDSLPSLLPDARIMSYGYNSKTLFTGARTNIDGEAASLLDRLGGERRDSKKRPIIFVCHHLGGIIVKKAIIIAHERSRYYGDLLSGVRGCVFLGVPHHGIKAAYWATIAAKVIKVPLLGSVNTEFIEALQQDSATLSSISKQFVEREATINITDLDENELLDNQLACASCVELARRALVEPESRIP